MYSIISSKNDVLLCRNKNLENEYQIKFSIKSNKIINPCEHINLDLYNILLKVNSDVFDDIVVNKIDDNKAIITLFLKQFGKEYGLKARYINNYVELLNINDKNFACIVSKTTDIHPNINIENYDEMICNSSRLSSFWNNETNELIVQYDFKLDDNSVEKLPKSMKDMSALIMKKVFIRMKTYKENEINN